jgi:hypothetical protein
MSEPGSYSVSQITPQIFLGPVPHDGDVAYIRSLGVTLTIDMIFRRPPKGLYVSPARLLRLPTIDFPLFPIPLTKLLAGVEAAIPALADGEHILVYCRWGRHRSVAMTASILIALGMSADEAMDLITEHRAAADPHIWYIEKRIRAFEAHWLANQGADADAL